MRRERLHLREGTLLPLPGRREGQSGALQVGLPLTGTSSDKCQRIPRYFQDLGTLLFGLTSFVVIFFVSSCKFQESTPPYASEAAVVIEYVSGHPKHRVERTGDRSSPGKGDSIAYTAHLRTLGGGPPSGRDCVWLVDGRKVAASTLRPAASPRECDGRFTTEPFTLLMTEDVHSLCFLIEGTNQRLEFPTSALTVKIAMEKDWYEKASLEFPSVEARVRESFSRFHASFEAAKHPELSPDGIKERFRIDAFEVYTRRDGHPVPTEFWNHPDYDLYVTFDEGGAIGGYYASNIYSVGHNYPGHPGHVGLFSDWGENCLFHEIAHYRGVQDFYVFNVPDEAIELRRADGMPIRKGYSLPDELARCCMNNPYQELEWSGYAACVINKKLGVSRVGECEDTDNPYGHMWNDVPEHNRLQVMRPDGTPVADAAVLVYRMQHAGDGDRRCGVLREDARPYVEGETDADGSFSLGDDPFGRALPRGERPLWLFVVVSIGDGEHYEYITLLDANVKFWSEGQEGGVYQIFLRR